MLRFVDAAVTAPGAGEVSVKMAAIGVNFIETYQRSGVYTVPLPFFPGAEGAGHVVEVGQGVTQLRVGDLVATAEGNGAYAEYMTVEAAKLVRVPDGIDPVTAAAVPLQGFTAHYLIHNSYAVQPGDTVLTTAGAGGVGQILTQLLKRAGATVITTTSSEAKADIARAAGADHVLRYEQVPAAVRELTDGRGVNAVFDGVGRDTFDASLGSLARRGTMVLFGGASGQVPPFDLQRLNQLGSATITRPSLKDFLTSAQERAWRAGDVFGAVSDGSLRIDVGQRFELRHADQAHRFLESRASTGKVVLLP
ncbi:quinone oxidoreductase family protein [Galactobacter caseinivorans]|uniref:Quinone oxidoreductase n=1 Tax=Galactobacter caseinivorans TaxID=2676123 RepID=A0A496PK83_9MICC|nr:quinone oxidoreductase [Galactobacter caseinivorans]RKW70914.1 quinone oxidoreductase [Galactobacter caseinivorans]